MRNRVLFTGRAEDQLVAAMDWYFQQDRATAMRWKAGIRSLVRRLPKIAPKSELAPESDQFPVKMHQVLFGLGRKKTHRIVFVIRPEAI